MEKTNKEKAQSPEFIEVLDEKELYKVAGGCGCATSTHSVCASDGVTDGDTKQF